MRTDGRTDGRTDMTKLIVASRNFTKAPSNMGKNAAGQARDPIFLDRAFQSKIKPGHPNHETGMRTAEQPRSVVKSCRSHVT